MNNNAINPNHTVNDAKGTHNRGGVVDPLACEHNVPKPLYYKPEDAAKKEHPKQLLIGVKNAFSK